MAKKIKHKARKPLPTRWAWLANFRLVALGLFLLSIVLYANTFGHDYTQDDAIVITDNMYTQEGISGIPGLFTKDTFFGFFKKEGKDRLVSGGRYRPLTPSLFAIEYQLFGGKPGPMHVLNALWYGLTVVVLYGVLLALFRIRGQWDKKLSTIALYWVPLAAAVLFAVHPLHTEAVANIKGRDEIITLLGSLAALWFVLRGGTKHLLLGALCFFGALLAKENAITFLGVVPLALYVFTKDSVGHIVGKTAPLLAAAVLFIVLRGAVIGFQFGEPSQEFMNNPYLKIENNEWVPFTAGEKAATVTYTLGKYAQLLVVPHPLTHDYYPRQVDLKTFGDPLVLLSLFLHLGLLGYGLWSVFTQRSIAGFGILYYLGTLSIVSNIVFPVGTHLSERFLFMPSVGFALVIAHTINQLVKNRQAATAIVGGIGLIFAVLTVLRNPTWESNYRLFTTDIQHSPNSAKLRHAVAGVLTETYGNLPKAQQDQEKAMLAEALGHVNEALRLHPTYKQAYFTKGNLANYLRQFDVSINAYNNALRIDPDFEDAHRNLMITYRDAGRYYGEERGELAKAIGYLEQAYAALPNDAETVRLLGVAYGISGNNAKATELFTKRTQLEPNNARAWYDLGVAHSQAGRPEAADTAMAKARELDPEIAQKVRSGQ